MGKKTKIQIICFLVLAAVTLSGCGFKQTNPNQYSMKLEVWGLFDDSDVFNSIFETYRKMHPQIAEISYKKLSVDTYKNDLISALASGQGPDIFIIQNTWLPGFLDKTSPAPPEILNEQKYQKDFVDVAADDFIFRNQIYAVPMSVDSLGLYYNKDLFNQEGITEPPTDWIQFVADAKRLTKRNVSGEIVQSGASIGTAYNINRPTDILNLLMLQNKTEMVDPSTGRAIFDQVVRSGDQTFAPGENALNFYTQFARISSPNYSWNPTLHYSLDAFSEGRVAMMFNYSWNVATISSKAPKLNFAVAPVPQLFSDAQINYANYWGYAVAKNKTAYALNSPTQLSTISNETRIKEAWNLLNFLTAKKEINSGAAAQPIAGVDPNFDAAKTYLEKTGKPAARRDLIEMQKTNPQIGVFAAGNLIAKDWAKTDAAGIESIFLDMINKVNLGQATVADSLKAAAAQASQLSVN